MAEKITKNNWYSSFELIGKAKIKDDGSTFSIDATSKKSNWIYNSANFGVDCGEKSGVIYTNLMGGYSSSGNKVIYTMNNEGQSMTIDWEDRLDEDIINQVSPTRIITVALERTADGSLFKKKFINAYDAVAYIKEKIKPDDVIRVYGNLEWYKKNDGTSDARKTIRSIYLSDAEPKDFKAKFTQSVLINKDSASLKNIDKDRGILYLDGIVLHYLKEVEDVVYKNQFPFSKTFEYPMDFNNKTLCEKIMNKFFKVKKNTFTQINFNGSFVGGGTVVLPTIDELPDDVKDLLELGEYTEEDLIQLCASKSNSGEIKWVLDKSPMIKRADPEKNTIPELMIYREIYTEDEIYEPLNELKKPDEEDDVEAAVSEVINDSDTTASDSMSWLDNL